MQFSTSLVALIALYATSAYGKCFQTGENWGDHQVAKAQLAFACAEMQGDFGPGVVRGTCRNSPSADKSFRFEIQNETGQDASIEQNECERNIGAQIDNCGHGGQITTSGVRFRYVFIIRKVTVRRGYCCC